MATAFDYRPHGHPRRRTTSHSLKKGEGGEILVF